MPKTTKITQRKWIKGVVAASTDFAQPQGSFPRGSNIVYTRRGGLKTCDGSAIISAYNGSVQPPSADFGLFTDIFLYQPIGADNQYFGLLKDFQTHIGPPTAVTAADGGAGNLPASSFFIWVVTAVDGAGGETIASTGSNAGVPLVLAANHQADLSWTAPVVSLGIANLPVGYNVYRSSTFVTAFKLVNPTPISGLSYTDNVADADLIDQQPPGADSTQVTRFLALPGGSYDYTDTVKIFPADPPANIDGTAGGGGGGAGGGHSSNKSPTPAGGTAGGLSPLPLIVQFNNLMVLLLGNGITPYVSDGTTAGTTAITNSFVATYPARQNSTAYGAGDMITVTVGSAQLFKAIQGGTSASSAPTFTSVLNKTVADGSVIWQNIGPVQGSNAPPGAAHGIVYAGSLWIGNTSPTQTSDNQDGPSALKMSDLNNPNSWNPLNLAFLDRDDGTQITGMATFTIAESGIPPTGSLVVFKDRSTFQINGVFGASNFSIQRAQTDLGCMAPRSIQFVPGFGIVRYTHLGFAVFDGTRDRLLSEEIRPYLFGGQSDIAQVDQNYLWFSKAAQVADPPMYVCAMPTTQQSFLPFTGVTVASGAVASCTIPPGSYYCKVAKTRSDGSVFLSQEFGPIVIDSTHGFLVTTPVPSGGDTGLTIYYGLTPGGEDTFVNFPVSPTTHFITTPGLAGTPTSGGGQLTRLFCYDLVLKAWTIIDLPFPISVLRQFKIIGSIPITVMAGFADGATRRWQMGDANWDAGATNNGAPDLLVRAFVRTPEVFGKAASDRVYFSKLAIRGVGDPASLLLQAVISGVAGGMLRPRNVGFGSDEFVSYFQIDATGMDAYSELDWTGPLEIDSVDWLAIAKAIKGEEAFV